MDQRKSKWFKDTLTKYFSFILVVIITSMFSVITVNFLQINPTDNTQQWIILVLKILYAFSILLIAAIVLVMLFAKNFIHDLDGLLLHECVPQDITIVNIEKTVSFGPDSEENGCNIIETREIRNNMPHDYNRYLFSRRMSNAPPTFDKFKFYVDNETTPRNYSVEDINFEVDEPRSKDPDVLSYKVEFKFPIQAKPHENKKMKVEHPSHSFNDALKGNTDWIEHDVNGITEKLQINVKLVDGFEKNHYIDYPSPPKDNDGAQYDIEVRDYSRQRMWNSEAHLKKDNIMPTFSSVFTPTTGFLPNSRLKWVIYHPKIGYKYRLYFTIKRRFETATKKQSSLSDIIETRPGV